MLVNLLYLQSVIIFQLANCNYFLNQRFGNGFSKFQREEVTEDTNDYTLKTQKKLEASKGFKPILFIRLLIEWLHAYYFEYKDGMLHPKLRLAMSTI